MTSKNSKTTLSDNITLDELFAVIWQRKWSIMIFVFICSVGAVFYTLSLPNIYRAEMILAPAGEDSSLKLPGQLGGLAALAGVNLGSSSGKDKTLAIEVLKSRGFMMRFIEKYDLYVPAFAAKGWDRETDTLIINEKLYDPERQEWVREHKPYQQVKPSSLEVHKEFEKTFNLDQDKLTGMIKVSLQHYSPALARDWLTLMVKELNEDIRVRTINEAESSIAFLQKHVNEAEIADIRTMLYLLIEEQTKNLMLANVRDEYVLKVVDPAVVPEEKYGPKRALIVVLIAFLSTILAMLVSIMMARK
ncbi:Wzz/FepE/Etk N-terminal domain-containing protein [Rheinheimera sp. MMS21-TC3]|uniref:Wzz/FepE/Etk N-terminal domain-containing protein n=1 Tax=Rheinheimera sp. MMS21-TC3 TaxID=3072790 RepID=UPI0028C4A1E3|nr:Wzz/FepE/Etk N-terminal domain-containing protein [Rheinheimera sp. MMS21-TC3]WNO61682.1 Wzz/FepE/Etk N-terminal domain-containing protein [Rheinheimera sp. MMS21-TC3]